MSEINDIDRRRADMYYDALSLSDIYPNVSKVTVKCYSKSGSFEGAEIDSVVVRNPNDKFLFLVKCPNGSCTDIGFDLGGDVRDVIRNRKPSSSGTKKCNGWEDSERIGKHECLSEVEFTITVEYY